MKVDYSDIHKDIVERSKKGERKAQYQLYKLYAKAMFNICLRLMGQHEEAEDMLQEAFTDAFRRLHTFEFKSSFGAWLKRIVINRCINELKRKKTNLVLMEEIVSDETETNDFEQKNIEKDVKKIHKAIEKLADGYRVIFSLYLLEGYDHKEIAQILNITESTSKSQYMRAKRKLQEILSQHQLSFNQA